MESTDQRPRNQQEGYLQSGDVRLRYTLAGAVDRPAALCLHGGGHTSAVWWDLMQRLAGRWRVIALDQRGHGDSGWSPEARYLREDYVADIGVVLDHLGIGQAALVGHSLGGSNALLFAEL